MKNVSLISITAMLTLFLFLSCHKDDSVSSNENKSITEKRVTGYSSIPSELIYKLNLEWFKKSSKERRVIYDIYGDIHYAYSKKITKDSAENTIYAIPFIKNSKLTGYLLYYISDTGNKFMLVNINELLNLEPTDILTTYGKKLTKLMFLTAFDLENQIFGKISSSLLDKYNLIKVTHVIEPRCISISLIPECFEIITIVDQGVDGIVQTTHDECSWTVEIIDCGETSNWTSSLPNYNEFVSYQGGYITVEQYNLLTGGSGGSGNTTYSQEDLDKLWEDAKRKEIEKCMSEQISPLSDAKLDEMLENVEFPCVSDKAELMARENLKQKIFNNWCEEQRDNPGELFIKTGQYVKQGIKLSEIESALNQAISQNAVLDFVNNATLIDPCTGEEIDKDPIIDDLCASGKLNEAGLNSKLEGVDYIRINKCKDKSISELCPKLAKIMDLFIGEKASIPTCDLLKGLGSSIKTGVFYNLDCENNKITPREDGSKPLGQTYNSQNTNIGIYFNEDLCNKSCLEIASVFIHESLHAEFLRKAFENLPANMKDAFPTAIEFKAAWASMIENEFNNISNQHDIMAAFYVVEYAKAMCKAFGEQGKWESYRYWAYKGLNVAQAVAAGSTIITQEKYTEYTNEWNAIKNQLTINCEK